MRCFRQIAHIKYGNTEPPTKLTNTPTPKSYRDVTSHSCWLHSFDGLVTLRPWGSGRRQDVLAGNMSTAAVVNFEESHVPVFVTLKINEGSARQAKSAHLLPLTFSVTCVDVLSQSVRTWCRKWPWYIYRWYCFEVERSKVKVRVKVRVKDRVRVRVRVNSNRRGFELYECLLVVIIVVVDDVVIIVHVRLY